MLNLIALTQLAAVLSSCPTPVSSTKCRTLQTGDQPCL